jgi:hypothetical protein
MKAPPNPIRPITIEQVRGIIKGLGGRYVTPSDDDMARLAAVYTGMQYRNLPPEEEFPGFPIRLLDVGGNEVIIRRPLFPPGVHPFDWDKRAFGHPRHFEIGWKDPWPAETDPSLAHNMAAEFRRAMDPTNPGRSFGDKYAVARFLEKIIPLVTGETPARRTIERHLKKPYQRKRPRKRIR